MVVGVLFRKKKMDLGGPRVAQAGSIDIVSMRFSAFSCTMD
jgi:hypothetical protein